MSSNYGLQKCGKPDCLRKVHLGVAFCCGECWVAAAGGFEIHAHSVTCNARSLERGFCTPEEAYLLRQDPEPVAVLPEPGR